ncbi:MAG: hypothetical protein HYT79_11410 [Elusimicrobia bacterium]|nr:hypothetical protein [Elusimicrobiota bacterium]
MNTEVGSALNGAVIANGHKAIGADVRRLAKGKTCDKRIATLTISYAVGERRPGHVEMPCLRLKGLWMDKLGWQIGERVFVVANPNVIVIGRWEHNGLPLGCCPRPELRWKQSNGCVVVHCKTCGFRMDDDGCLADWRRAADREWCEQCGASNDGSINYCPKCLYSDRPWCKRCDGMTSADHDGECNRCGLRVIPVDPKMMAMVECPRCRHYAPVRKDGSCLGCGSVINEHEPTIEQTAQPEN